MRRFRFIPTDGSGLDIGKTGSGWIFEEQGPIHAFSWSPDHILEEKGRGLSVRVSSEAVREMRAWTRRSVRTAGPKVETGGLVFGALNDAAGVLWVTEVEGPPPDSDAAEDHFTCGTEGMEEAPDEKNRRFRGSVACTGPAGRHLVELQPLVLAPSEEPAHLVGVGGPGGIGDSGREELVRGKAGRLAGAHEDGREGPFEVGFGRRIRGSENKFLGACPRTRKLTTPKKLSPYKSIT